MIDITKQLTQLFPEVKCDESLFKYTTSKVGGKALWFVEARSSQQIIDSISICLENYVPYFILGGGSNVIFSDLGFYGLVIRNRSQYWQVLESLVTKQTSSQIIPRFNQRNQVNLNTVKFDHDEEKYQHVLVRTDSGIKLSTLMKALYSENITGLQWFAGIPGTIGGAIYMNIHGGNHYFSELIERVTLVDKKSIKIVNNDYFRFEYDYSILHKTKEIVLQADLRLRKGNVEKSKQFAINWAKEKAYQPRKSAGCIFRNITQEEQNKLKLPSSSSGYIIDKVLNLKGKRIGNAIISTQHAAFIENKGNALASDFFRLAQFVKQKAKEKLDLNLQLEIEFIGEFKGGSWQV